VGFAQQLTKAMAQHCQDQWHMLSLQKVIWIMARFEAYYNHIYGQDLSKKQAHHLFLRGLGDQPLMSLRVGMGKKSNPKKNHSFSMP
jgi:hypothetical protein